MGISRTSVGNGIEKGLLLIKYKSNSITQLVNPATMV